MAEMNGSKTTVLLVEDNAELRTLVSLMLQMLGCNVISAESATDAREIGATIHTDLQLLLTDINMPEMSGQQLAKELLALRPGLPVLFMSGDEPEPAVSQSMGSSTCFIRKPFVKSELAAKLSAALDSPAAEKQIVGKR